MRGSLSIRSGMGLGDSLYLQSVARYFVAKRYHVEVCSAWPDVFRPLSGNVTVTPFRRDRIDRLAHYSMRRGAVGTTQFQDCCLQAGITERIDLKLDWVPLNPYLRFVTDKPVIAVQLPRAPMDRKDGLGRDLMPDYRVTQRAIDALRERAFIVQIGAGEPLHHFKGIDLDLANKTSVCDLLDVAFFIDGFLGYCSFVIPLAESLDKPALLIWARGGLKSRHQVIRQMTPKKILHKPSSRAVIDNSGDKIIDEAAHALLEQVGRAALV